MSERKENKLSPEIQKLAESVGNFIQYWGFKSIHGKIWTLLFISQEPLSAIELSRQLKVSKTLLSFSMAELLKYQVIQESGKGVKRTVYFRANPDLTAVILNVLKTREKPMMEEIHSACQQLQEKVGQSDYDFKINPHQLQDLGKFITAAQDALGFLMQRTGADFTLLSQFLFISGAFSQELLVKSDSGVLQSVD